MGQDKLEKFIKKQVEEHHTSTDPDLLWQKIQAKQNLEKKPKRRFFIFWLLGGAFLLASIALLYTFQFSNTESDQINSTLSANEKAIDQNNVEQKNKETISDLTESKNTKQNTATAANTEKKANINTNSNTNENTSTNTNTNRKTNANTSTTKPNSVADDKNVTGASLNNTTAKQDDSFAAKTAENNTATTNDLVKTSQSKTDNNLATAKTNLQTTSTTDTDQLVIPIPNNQNLSNDKSGVENESLNTTNTPELNTKKGKVVEVAANVESKKSEDSKQSDDKVENASDQPRTVVKSELLPITSGYLLLDQKVMDSDLVELMKGKTPKFDEKSETLNESQEKKWSFSNGAAFTYGKGLRTLSAKESTPANYVETRNEMETSLDAIRFNLDFMLQHKNGLYLKTGLEYEQINERFNSYVEWDSTEVDPDQLLAVYYDINGTPLERKGAGEVTTRYWLQKKKFNRYRSIDIPLIVGYQSKQENKRLGWFVEGGASVNIWFRPSGEIFSPTDQALDLKENTDLFRTRTGVSLLGAAGLTYKLGDKFSIWASPEVKYHLNSITSDINTLDQKYLNVGLRLGIRYHW